MVDHSILTFNLDFIDFSPFLYIKRQDTVGRHFRRFSHCQVERGNILLHKTCQDVLCTINDMIIHFKYKSSIFFWFSSRTARSDGILKIKDFECRNSDRFFEESLVHYIKVYARTRYFCLNIILTFCCRCNNKFHLRFRCLFWSPLRLIMAS